MLSVTRVGFAVLCVVYSCRSYQETAIALDASVVDKSDLELVFVPNPEDVPSKPRIIGSSRTVLVSLPHDGRAAVDVRVWRTAGYLVIDAIPAEGFELFQTMVCVSDLYAKVKPAEKWPPCTALQYWDNPNTDDRQSIWIPLELFEDIKHGEQPRSVIVLVRLFMGVRGKTDAGFFEMTAPTLDLE